jgi:hypothetical protein
MSSERALSRHVSRTLGWALALAVAGCPPSTPEPDASEALPDAASPDAARDAGPPCDLRCATTQERCCLDESGAPECIDVTNDPRNCGLCGLDCIATHRGDRCAAMQCGCGDFSIGCTGRQDNYCCPTAPDGRSERCANLGRDFGDCGECGRTCDAPRADRCEGGECTCGAAGTLCDGTPTSLCCVDLFEDATCVDTTRDKLHCGGCNIQCGAFEDCIDGDCVDFTLRDAGTGSSDGGSSDGGSSDGGASDGGSSDGGPSDAGPSDVGPSDVGTDAGAPDAPGAEADAGT